MVQLKNGGGIRATLVHRLSALRLNFVLTILANKGSLDMGTIARECQRLTLGVRLARFAIYFAT